MAVLRAASSAVCCRYMLLTPVTSSVTHYTQSRAAVCNVACGLCFQHDGTTSVTAESSTQQKSLQPCLVCLVIGCLSLRRIRSGIQRVAGEGATHRMLLRGEHASCTVQCSEQHTYQCSASQSHPLQSSHCSLGRLSHCSLQGCAVQDACRFNSALQWSSLAT